MALINTIYLATEGEGFRIGTPQIFVRFQGCAIGCINCDSMETWEFDERYQIDLDEVMERIEQAGDKRRAIKNISITGGDPLHPKHVPDIIELIKRLKQKEYFINIEASGSRIIPEVFDDVDFISMDFKTPSTNVRSNPNLLVKLVKDYPNKYQIKSVVKDKKDFEASLDALEYIQSHTEENILWSLTPCYEPGEDFPKERFENIIEMNQDYGSPFRVIGQQHKWIFGPDKKQT